MRLLPTLAAAALASPAVAEVPKVITDIQAVHSLAAQVMGELGAPELLLDQGGDPHAFQLRPSQARSLAEADLVFWIGPELTPWLDRALEGMAPQGEAVALLPLAAVTHAYGEDEADHGDEHVEGEEDHTEEHAGHDDHAETAEEHAEHAESAEEHAEHAESAEEHAEGEEGHDDHDDHGHDGTDPHAWLDPANARAWLGVIADHLAEADPGNAATYAANAATALAALDALEAELRETLAPVADRPIYVFHDAYRYFEEAFGVNIAGTIAEGDAADPGAARLAEIRAGIEADGAACVFAEANHNPAYATNLVEGTGIGTGTLDPEGSSHPAGPGHYAAMLRALAGEIARCVTAAG